MRARDADRNQTCQTLDAALAEGQLSMEEHRQRVAAATNAATLGDLEGLVTDLQPSTTSANPHSRLNPRGRRLMVAAGTVGVLVLATTIGVILFSRDDTSTSDAGTPSSPSAVAEKPVAPKKPTDPGAVPDDVPPSVLNVPRQLHTLGGMNALFEQMRKRFGDTVGIELAISPDNAMLFRPDPTDDKSKLLYRFDGGWGDATRRPRDENDGAADLGAFDVKAVAEVLRTAPETLGIAPDDAGDVVVDIDPLADPAGPGPLELLVKVEKKSGGAGFIYLDSAGNTKRVEYPG